MLSPKLYEALNAQINAEFWSAYLYLSMSADFEQKGLPGFANWMHIQFREEQDHAMKLFNFIVSRGGKPELLPIDKVQTSWKSPLDSFKDTLKHEQEVTAMINNLYFVSTEQKDYATQSMLQWFIDEQVEEEKTAQEIIDSLTLIADNGLGMHMLDKEFAARVYVPIATAK